MRFTVVIISMVVVVLVVGMQSTTYSQTLADDTLIVRAILDSNQMVSTPVSKVTYVQQNRVRRLSFAMSGIGTLTAAVGKLTALDCILANDCALREIPASVGNCVEMVSINVNKNAIRVLPAELKNCTKMERLYFESNSISEIPEGYSTMTALADLRMADNLLKKIPPYVATFTKLKIVTVGKNFLTEIPEDIGNCTLIEYFDISDNRINKLPESITRLTPTQYCDLGKNNLDSTKMSTTQKAWADKYDPDWRKTQIVPISHFTFANRQSSVAMDVSGHSLRYTLSTPQKITLSLLDMQGRLLSQLYRGFSPEGNHTIPIESPISGSGNYIIRLTTANGNAVQRVHVVR